MKTTVMDHPEFSGEHVRANGIRMHVVRQGSGPLVVLLHGFPEFWRSWRHQIPVLAKRFTVAAPDLRGYNNTERPTQGYDTVTLARDIAELIHALGHERAHVVGHDWGGVLAYWVAIRHPEVVDRLAILDAPHPARFFESLTRNPNQMRKSLYILFFQIPRLPEWFLRWRRGYWIEMMFRLAAARRDAFTAEELGIYRAAMCEPGAIEAALAYYRCAFKDWRRMNEARKPIPHKTLILWGDRDAALGVGLTRRMDRYVPNSRVVILSETGHWIQQERPEEVNRHLMEYLSGPDARTQPR